MKWHAAPSNIHGTGAFASEVIPSNEPVGHLIRGLNAGGLLGGEQTELGKYLNHQSRPNGRMEIVPGTVDQYYLKSLSDIEPGSELTMNYNDTPDFVAKPKDLDPEGYKSWK